MLTRHAYIGYISSSLWQYLFISSHYVCMGADNCTDFTVQEQAHCYFFGGCFRMHINKNHRRLVRTLPQNLLPSPERTIYGFHEYPAQQVNHSNGMSQL